MMISLKSYPLHPESNNLNQFYMGYTTTGILEHFGILTFGYLMIEDQLILAINGEENGEKSDLEENSIYICELLYHRLQNKQNASIRKCPIPCKLYDENKPQYNLLPDCPIAKKLHLTIFYNRNAYILDCISIKAFLSKPFYTKKNQIHKLTLTDPTLIQQLQLLNYQMNCKTLYQLKKINSNNNNRFIYFKILDISGEVESDFYIIDISQCQIEIEKNYNYELLPSQQIDLGLEDQIYCQKEFNRLKIRLENIIELKESVSIAIECQKNLGKRSLFKQLAMKYGMNYFEKDISTVGSMEFIYLYIEKIKECPCILYLRNTSFIQQIVQLKSTQPDFNQISQYLIKIVKLIKQQPFIILIISNESFTNIPLIKSSFDFYIDFKPKNDLEIAKLFINHFQLDQNEQEIFDLIKDIQWRQVQKLIQKDKNNFVKSIEALNKSIQFNINIAQTVNSKVKMEDVGGMELAIKEVGRTIILPQLYPELFDELVKPRRGILFFGPPGTGKTLLAKCIAAEMNMNFISVKGPEMLNMYIGESESNIRDLFRRANENSPSLVFFDELDALAPVRGNQSDSNQVMDRIVAQLLTEIDSLKQGTFIIGATNRPDLLDPALMRPGRFDKLLYLGIKSDKESRTKILRALIKTNQFDDFVDEIPLNFTGADFYGLVSSATIFATKRTIDSIKQDMKGNNKTIQEICKQKDIKVEIQIQDLRTSLASTKPSVSLKELEKYEELRKKYE